MTQQFQVWCEHCWGPAQHVVWYEDPRDKTRVVEVRCHGVKETGRMPEHDLQNGAHIVAVRAFRPALAHG